MTPLKNNGLMNTINILDKKDKLDKENHGEGSAGKKSRRTVPMDLVV